jgi:hypothetical protein
MITLVFTFRNRSLHIVKKCLQSLAMQSNSDFKVVVVNYGSDESHSKQIEALLKDFHFVTYLHCKVLKQLWNKSKAINIVLKECQTPHFFVADIDMIFRYDFIEKLHELKSVEDVIYFQVGFLSESESNFDKSFGDYKIKHLTNFEATGMTLYPTALLKSINGYDEFYHGWGAEDTDVHYRLQNAGNEVKFYDDEILLLHQWHQKSYRTKESSEPFHSRLEQINHQYINKVADSKLVLANTVLEWGAIPNTIDFLQKNVNKKNITNQEDEVNAFLHGSWDTYKGQCLMLEIKAHVEYKSLKNSLKKVLGKKHFSFFDFQTLNDMILIHLVARYRNCYYEYEWNKKLNSIQLKIVL